MMTATRLDELTLAGSARTMDAPPEGHVTCSTLMIATGTCSMFLVVGTLCGKVCKFFPFDLRDQRTICSNNNIDTL